MKVYSAMKREPSTCTLETDLATAGRMMARVGCGFLPVVDADLVKNCLAVDVGITLLQGRQFVGISLVLQRRIK